MTISVLISDENQSSEAENNQNWENMPDGPAPPAKSNVEHGNKENNIDFLNHSKSSVVGVKLDSDAFQRCNEMMREKKSDIAILNSTEGTSSNDDLKNSIHSIGGHIEHCLECCSEDQDELRSSLWSFVAQFTNSEPDKLYKLFHYVKDQRNQRKRKTPADSDSSKPPSKRSNKDSSGVPTEISHGESTEHSSDASTEESSSEESSDEESETESEHVFRPYLTEKNPPDSTFVWKKADLKTPSTAFTNPPTIALYNGPVTPYALFNLFFDDETIQLIVQMTNNYAKKHKGDAFTTNESEIRLFLAILLVSGYSELPRKHLYRERQSNIYNKAVATAMPCYAIGLIICSDTSISATMIIRTKMTRCGKSDHFMN